MDASQIPQEWLQRLERRFGAYDDSSLREYLAKESLTSDILPPKSDRFRCLHLTTPGRVKVVILGQDPYPTPGNAHGLAFSVRPGVAIPASLKNIFKERESDLKLKIPTHGCLNRWQEQGVLLLNRVLSVRAGEPGSHRKRGWEIQTDGIITLISEGEWRTVFVLWGNDAQAVKPLIDATRHVVIESVHPSPLSARRGFFGSRPFSRANEALASFGRSPIDWRLDNEGE